MVSIVAIFLKFGHDKIVIIDEDLICLTITDKNLERKEPSALNLLQQAGILRKALNRLSSPFILRRIPIECAHINNPINLTFDWLALFNQHVLG
jgi:hypothetical protein